MSAHDELREAYQASLARKQVENLTPEPVEALDIARRVLRTGEYGTVEPIKLARTVVELTERAEAAERERDGYVRSLETCARDRDAWLVGMLAAEAQRDGLVEALKRIDTDSQFSPHATLGHFGFIARAALAKVRGEA